MLLSKGCHSILSKYALYDKKKYEKNITGYHVNFFYVECVKKALNIDNTMGK
jgi:hypothetical protein